MTTEVSRWVYGAEIEKTFLLDGAFTFQHYQIGGSKARADS